MFSRHLTKAGVFALAVATASLGAAPVLVASQPAFARHDDNNGDHGRRVRDRGRHTDHDRGKNGDHDRGQPPVVTPPPTVPPPPDHPPA